MKIHKCNMSKSYCYWDEEPFCSLGQLFGILVHIFSLAEVAEASAEVGLVVDQM